MPSFVFGDDPWAQLLVLALLSSLEIPGLESRAHQSGRLRQSLPIPEEVVRGNRQGEDKPTRNIAERSL